MSNNKVSHNCKHCNKLGASIYDKDSDGYFCCSGCLMAYRFINDKGLDAYYDKRGDISSDPVLNVKLDSSVFNRSTRVTDDGMNEVTILINNIRCAACIWLLEKIFLKDSRIKDIRINYSNHKAKIKFDPQKITIDEVLEKITKLGYYPLPFELTVSASDKERRDYFFRFGTAAFFSMQLMLYSAALYTGYFQGIDHKLKNFFHLISWALATPVIFYCAYPFFKNSFYAIKNKHWNMDTLVALGSGSAYIYSIFAIFLGKETYFDTAATIVTLILLGRFIEAGAKQRGGNAVAKLLSLRPSTVQRVDNIKDLSVTTISIELLKVNDLFLVEKGGSIGADGKIFSGDTDIDESMLTGEPIPVSRSIKDNIFAGTINLSSDIIVECTHIGDETFLSKVAKAVDDAESSKAPIQDIADRFVGRFVTFVLIVAGLTFIGSEFLTLNSTADNIMRAVSVLVIACPCAMGLATPLAIISATTKLAEKGIIFKNGKAIELFAKVKFFFFDKTGTITEASMQVEEYKFIDKNKRLLDVASKLGDLSSHPVSKAISLLTSNSLSDIKITQFSEIAGKGVKGVHNNKSIMLGSVNMMNSNDTKVAISPDIQNEVLEYQSSGRTVSLFAYDNRVIAVFGITDTIRKDSKETIDLLHSNGNEVAILTGDNEGASNYILSKNKINAKLYANLSPFQKAELIAVQNNNGGTVMIGDGINDAVALSSATVGISMRTSTDISMESSQAVLLRNDLSIIPIAHKISKKALRIIKENLFWAFSYNIVAIPLAVSGLIHPVMSALFMSFSSLIVIANSSRLKR